METGAISAHGYDPYALELIASCRDGLVLDELGSQKPSMFVQDILYYLINSRYNAQRTTIFTTNYRDAPPKNEMTLTGRIGDRVRSRLYEMCQVVPIEGKDFRREIRKADFRY